MNNLAEIATGGGNGTAAAAITMEQLLMALTQVVGQQTNNRVMKNKETQTGTIKEQKWDNPVAKSKVNGRAPMTVRNFRTKKDAVSGARKPNSKNGINNSINNKQTAKDEAASNNSSINKKDEPARKAAGKQKTLQSKKETGDDNGHEKEANGTVNGDPDRCALFRGQSFPPFLVC